MCDIGEDKEKALPALAHSKGLVRRVAMQKERLSKKRQVPVQHKKYNNNPEHNAVFNLKMAAKVLRKQIKEKKTLSVPAAYESLSAAAYSA